MAVVITGNNTPTAGGVTYGDGSTYANTAAGSAGGVLYSAGSSAPAFTAAGTSGQLLQSNGASAPTWTTPSSGALTLLATITPTVAANVDFLNTFSSTYDCYLINCTGVTPASYGGSPGPQFRFANGGIVDTGSVYNGFFQSAATSASNSRLTTNQTNYGAYSFQMVIANANETTNVKYMTMQLQYSPNGSSSDPTNFYYGAAYRGTSAISGIRIFWSDGGDFAATGKIRVYGYSNS